MKRIVVEVETRWCSAVVLVQLVFGPRGMRSLAGKNTVIDNNFTERLGTRCGNGPDPGLQQVFDRHTRVHGTTGVNETRLSEQRRIAKCWVAIADHDKAIAILQKPSLKGKIRPQDEQCSSSG